MHGKSFFLFLTGAAVGTALTSYFCSDQGVKMRHNLIKKGRDTFDRLYDQVEELIAEMSKKIPQSGEGMQGEAGEESADKWDKKSITP